MYDIIILGGGIAGSATAYNLHLMLPELQIAIIEPTEYGELPISVVTYVEYLEKYQLLHAIVHEYTEQRFESVSKIGYSTQYPQAEFALIDYGQACMTLQNRSKADIYRDMAVHVKGTTVYLQSGKVLEATYFIDSTGIFSKFRGGMEKPKLRTAVMFQQFKVNTPLNESSFSYVVGNGTSDSKLTSNGGWYYPIADDIIELGSAFFINDPEGKVRVNDYIKEQLSNSMQEILTSFFPNAIPINKSYTRITAYSPVKQVVKDNMLFIGDSVGTGDPFLCANVNRYLLMSEYLAMTFAEVYLYNEPKLLYKYQKVWEYELIHYAKRRMGRASILFKKSKEQWGKILTMRKEVSAQQTLEHRTGKKSYSLKYTLQRYPLRDILKLFAFEIKFHIKCKLFKPEQQVFLAHQLLQHRYVTTRLQVLRV